MKIRSKVETEVVSDVLCDMCHKSCGMEYMILVASWGYDSGIDGSVWNSQFCEDCSNKIAEFVKSNGGEINKREYL
jgi:hypothetical protein